MELRSAMFDAEAGYFFALLDGENGACPWAGKFTSFAELIMAYNLTAPSRYEGFKASLEFFTGDQVRTIGVDAAILTARIRNEQQRSMVLADVTRVTDLRGCQLTRNEVARRIQQIAPTPKLTNALKSVARVEDEVSRLRARVAELERENDALRSGIRALGLDPEAMLAREAMRAETPGGRSQPVSRGKKKRSAASVESRPAQP